MCNISTLLAIFIGFQVVLTNAMPRSPVTVNDWGNLTKDWSHVFTPGFYMASTIESGASMASITFAEGASRRTEIQGHVYNNCPFPIYARLAVNYRTSGEHRGNHECEHRGEYPDQMIPTGSTFNAPFKAKMDQCGFVIKVSRNRGDLRVYQVEYSGDDTDGRMWYNLSMENGAPLQEYARYLAGYKCPLVRCLPGQYGKDPVHGCDWPRQPVCATPGPVVAVMCGWGDW